MAMCLQPSPSSARLNEDFLQHADRRSAILISPSDNRRNFKLGLKEATAEERNVRKLIPAHGTEASRAKDCGYFWRINASFNIFQLKDSALRIILRILFYISERTDLVHTYYYQY